MAYLIFNKDKEYDQGSLKQHLGYLQRWGGSPDCWSGFETMDEFGKMLEEAKGMFNSFVIYDDFSERIIYDSEERL